MGRTASVAAAVGLASSQVLAMDNGFARPQTGYNSWYDVYMAPSEDHILATLAGESGDASR
jgi:hypothetical protein